MKLRERVFLRCVSRVGWLAWHISEICEKALIGRRALRAYQSAMSSCNRDEMLSAVDVLNKRDRELETLLGEHFAGTIRVMRNQLNRMSNRKTQAVIDRILQEKFQFDSGSAIALNGETSVAYADSGLESHT